MGGSSPNGLGGQASTPGAQNLLGGNTPLFTQEGPQFYQQAYKHNAPFATAGPYQTELTPSDEKKFRKWVSDNKVEFDPTASTVDYDMRGFWKTQNSGGEKSAVNPTDSRIHYPDTFKTPYDTTFSGESKYAKPGTPFVWQGNTLIDSRTGKTVYRVQKDN